jgi:hypothetical protein
MYAGLRVGEACAVTPASLEGNYLNISMFISKPFNISPSFVYIFLFSIIPENIK